MVRKTLSVPITTWQHFKHQYCPKWFLNWFPVVYSTYELRTEQCKAWSYKAHEDFIDKPLDNPRL